MKVISNAKLKELMLYISMKSEKDDFFGSIKLNKILFYCDFFAYMKLGKSITGQDYFKLPKVPAPRQLLPARQEMVDNGEIAIRKREFYGHKQERTFALRQPQLDRYFRPEEISLIDGVIEQWRDKSASEITERSHMFCGWSLATDKETIPYCIALVAFPKPSPSEAQYAETLLDYLPIAIGA